MPSDNYWMTSAQIMAVLALALVLEGRFYASKWTNRIPSKVRAAQIIIFLVPMLGMAVAIPGCLNALRTGNPRPWLPEVVQLSVAIGIGALLLNPAIDLMARTFSRHAATLLVRSSVWWQSKHALYWKLRARLAFAINRKNIAKYQRKVRERLVELETLRNELDALPEETKQSPEGRRTLERTAQFEAAGRKFLEELDENRRNMEQERAERIKDAAEFKATMQRRIEDWSSQVENRILSEGIYYLGPVELSDDSSEVGDGAGDNADDDRQSEPD